MKRAFALALSFAALVACAPSRAVTRSVVTKRDDVPSADAFKVEGEYCAQFCPAKRAGEELLWCHTANADAEDAGDAEVHSEMVLVCNYGKQ
ncbi:hypothetical protein BH09MYX1_BH09MYX1_25600 [soil metagenome]